MTQKRSVALTMLACSTLWAADYRPLDVKTGQWETTVNSQMSGMPPIPDDVLNRMTPEQRAKIMAAMQARNGSKATVSKSCLTKDKLDKPFDLGDENTKSCTRTMITSSGSRQEARVDCTVNGSKTTGTIKVEAVDSGTVKGSMQMAVSSGERTMNMNMTFASRWLGPVCSEK